MKNLTIFAFAAAALAIGFSGAAAAETVTCPSTATPQACAENQAIHDYVTANPAFGSNPVFVAGAADVYNYLGSDPDANVRLALRRVPSTGVGPSPDKK